MRKFLLLFLALFLTASAPMISYAGDGEKPKEGEAEPECD